MPRIDHLSHDLRLNKNDILAICAKLNISAKRNSNLSNNQATRIREAARKQSVNPQSPGEATTALTANQSTNQDTANPPNPSKPTIALTANQSKLPDSEILGELLKMEERAKIAEERVKSIESDLSNTEAALAKREQAVAEKEAMPPSDAAFGLALNNFRELEAAARQEWVIQKQQKINAQREQIINTAEREAKNILDAAQKEADKIVEQAQALANQHRERVRQQTIQEIQAREAQLETRTRQLDAKEQSLDARESNVRTQDRKLKIQEQELEDENTWIASEKKRLRQKEEELLARERACSEEAIARVTAQKYSVEQQLSIIQAENYRLREELEKTKSILQAASGSPESLLEQNTRLENRLREYEQKFDEYPTLAELAELRRRAEAANQFEAMYRDLQARVDDSSLFAHYYDEHTIQAFIASMAASRLIIIQGVSGTGKTSLPEYFAKRDRGKICSY